MRSGHRSPRPGRRLRAYSRARPRHSAAAPSRKLSQNLSQGGRKEADEKNRRLPLPTAEIDAVVLSHAHIDHAGRLPFLIREGYQGTIWCTPATRDLCAVMLADSAHIQEKDA